MQRLQIITLLRLTLLAAPILVGCGNTISQIDGLPQTRDMSSVQWPLLVDTPAAPTDTLLPEAGARTLATLENAQIAALSRQAEPGPARVETLALQGKVARIDARTQVTPPAIDSAALSARAARLAQLRNEAQDAVAIDELKARAQRVSAATDQDYGAINTVALQARAQRITAATEQGYGTVDTQDLQARAQRVGATRSQGYGSVDSAELQGRANRVKDRTQTYYGSVDRADLATRSDQIKASTTGPAPEAPSVDLQDARRTAVAEAVTEPRPKPVSRSTRKDHDEPVLSNDFRKRARAAIERARKRAAAPPPE